MKVVTVRMRRLIGTTLGTLGIVGLLVVSLLLGAVLALPVNAHAARSGAGATTAVIQPAATYTVTFTESGLPAATTWAVSYNGTVSNTTTSVPAGAVVFPGIPAGAVAYNLVNASGYRGTPYTGTVTVTTANVAIAITFAPILVWFNESGLVTLGTPAQPTWGVNLGGASYSATASILFSAVPVGKNPFTVVNNTPAWGAYPGWGAVTVPVSGANVAVAITYKPTFVVTFNETGLPINTGWTVTFTANGTVSTTTASTLQFSERPGTYPFSVSNGSGYVATPYTGTITVVAAPVGQSISFAAGNPPTVAVPVFSTSFAASYNRVPFPVFFNISVSGTGNLTSPINSVTTQVTVTFRNIPAKVNTHVLTLAVSPGQKAYMFMVTNTSVSGGLPVGVGSQYQMTVKVTAVNITEPTTLVTSKSSALVTYLIFANPHGSFNAPVGGPSASSTGNAVGPGNVTVIVNYGGDFLSSANVTIYNSAGLLVFNSPTFAPGIGNRTVPAIAPWLATTPGVYSAVLTLNATYTNAAFTEWVTVSNVGGVVFYNTSTYHNSSLIPGLSAAAGGTLLLVVGLAVGMLVALVLGRMMWAGPKAAPAQAWAPTAGTNECPVCHQSFPTEEALKDHQKSAHGM